MKLQIKYKSINKDPKDLGEPFYNINSSGEFISIFTEKYKEDLLIKLTFLGMPELKIDLKHGENFAQDLRVLKDLRSDIEDDWRYNKSSEGYTTARYRFTSGRLEITRLE
jgi:hypothetical protein